MMIYLHSFKYNIFTTHDFYNPVDSCFYTVAECLVGSSYNKIYNNEFEITDAFSYTLPCEIKYKKISAPDVRWKELNNTLLELILNNIS